MEILDIIDDMEAEDIVKTIGKAIVTVFDYLLIRDPKQAFQMLNGLKKWINDDSLWMFETEDKPHTNKMYS